MVKGNLSKPQRKALWNLAVMVVYEQHRELFKELGE